MTSLTRLVRLRLALHTILSVIKFSLEEDSAGPAVTRNVKKTANPQTVRLAKRVAPLDNPPAGQHVSKKTALWGARKTPSVDGVESEASSGSEIVPRHQRNPEVRWVGPSVERPSASSSTMPQRSITSFGDGGRYLSLRGCLESCSYESRFRDSVASTPRRSVQFADTPPPSSLPMSGTYQQQSQRNRSRQVTNLFLILLRLSDALPPSPLARRMGHDNQYPYRRRLKSLVVLSIRLECSPLKGTHPFPLRDIHPPHCYNRPQRRCRDFLPFLIKQENYGSLRRKSSTTKW